QRMNAKLLVRAAKFPQLRCHDRAKSEHPSRVLEHPRVRLPPLGETAQLVHISAVEAHHPRHVESVPESQVIEGHIAEVRMQKARLAPPQPEQVSRVHAITRETTPQAM